MMDDVQRKCSDAPRKGKEGDEDCKLDVYLSFKFLQKSALQMFHEEKKII